MEIIHLAENLDLEAILKDASNIKRWAPIDFGKYEGLTIPQLIFQDPSYFYWALSTKAFYDQPLRDAIVAEGRLQHIKPPKAWGSSAVFVIKLKNGRFKDFEISERVDADSKKNSDTVIARHLDFSIISNPNENKNGGKETMVNRLKHHFFDKAAANLRRNDFQAFLSNPDNFAVGCRKKHVPGIPRWNDPKVLEETRDRELQKSILESEAMESMRDAKRDRIARRQMAESENWEA